LLWLFKESGTGHLGLRTTDKGIRNKEQGIRNKDYTSIMAKKSSKKQPNATNHGDTASVPVTTSIVTNQPANISQDAPAKTRLSFFDFITLATTEDIKNFLKLASTTSEGGNLGNLWRRAHAEGYKKGRKAALETETKDKFREGIAKGMDLGREQGYNVAKEAFDEIIKTVKAREASESKFSNAIVQTDPTIFSSTSQARTSIEKGIGTRLAPTIDFSVQTSPCVAHTPILSTSGTQTETRLPQNLKNSSLSRLATSPPSEFSGNQKSTKTESTCDFSSNITFSSLLTPSFTVFNPVAPSTTSTALEMRPTTAGFTTKHEKVENSSFFIQTSKTFTPSSVEPENDDATAHTTQLTPNNVISQPSTLSTTASSLPTYTVQGQGLALLALGPTRPSPRRARVGPDFW
jgi:hypothetical protein